MPDLPRIVAACERFLHDYHRLELGESATLLGPALRELIDAVEVPDAS